MKNRCSFNWFCAGTDLESSVSGRGGGNFRLFVLFLSSYFRGVRINILSEHHRPTSETPFQWRLAGGPMMAPGDRVIF